MQHLREHGILIRTGCVRWLAYFEYHKGYDMSSVRIQWYRPGESRLDRPALDSASSLAASLPPVSIEISGLVLESVSRAFM